MPRFAFPISEVQRSVSRPVAFEIIRKLIPIWGFNPEGMRVTMFGETESIPMTHSSLDPEPVINRLQTDKDVKMSIVETYSQNTGPYQPKFREDMPPIFWDDELQVWLRPIMREVEAIVTVTLRSRDRVVAESWGRIIQSRITSYAELNQFAVSYHYPIPIGAMGMVCNIHKLREQKYPKGDRIGQYLKEKFDDRMTILENQGGNGDVFAIGETQVGITGYHEFGWDIPETENQDQGTTHSVEFTYKYTYMRPEHVMIQYPLAIYNQMVPPNMIQKQKVAEIERYFRFRDSSFKWIGAHQRDVKAYQNLKGLPIPYYDDWMGFFHPPAMWQIFRQLTMVDDADRTDVQDLLDLGSWELNALAVQYMKLRPMAITRAYDSVFHVSLWYFDQLCDQANLVVDQDLKLSYPPEMDPRKVWHCTMTLVADPSLLSAQALADLLGLGTFCILYLNTLIPGLGDQLTLLPDGTIASEDFRHVCQDVGFRSNFNNYTICHRLYGGVIVHRMEP